MGQIEAIVRQLTGDQDPTVLKITKDINNSGKWGDPVYEVLLNADIKTRDLQDYKILISMPGRRIARERCCLDDH